MTVIIKDSPQEMLHDFIAKEIPERKDYFSVAKIFTANAAELFNYELFLRMVELRILVHLTDVATKLTNVTEDTELENRIELQTEYLYYFQIQRARIESTNMVMTALVKSLTVEE